jgi:hypothetical protein
MPLRPSQISRGLTWDGIQTSALTRLRLTAWSVARQGRNKRDTLYIVSSYLTEKGEQSNFHNIFGVLR